MPKLNTPSAKPGKQRKLLYNAPAHILRKHLAASLSPELQESYKVRSLPVRKGDTVTVTRGDYAGVEGKVVKVLPRDHRIHVEGVTREKTDGNPYPFLLDPSKVMIKRLNTDDKWRRRVLEEEAKAKSAASEAKGVK